MDQQMFLMLPDLQPDELMLLKELTKDMSDTQQQQFFTFYRTKRKEKKDMMIFTIIGFFGFAGIQRFVVGDTGMGVLYLLTGGLCGIGTIVDLVNLDKMVWKYNQKQAMETAGMMKMMGR